MDTYKLCQQLLRAETDADVLDVLIAAGYWDDPTFWRPVGDNEQNRGIVGNQQEDAVSALVEKLTNSIDAVLINRCLENGIDPKGREAPKGMREALMRFFPVSDSYEPTNRALLWGDERLTKAELDALAGNVWVTITGSKSSPSVTVADRGEGQTPDDFPKTFMALLGYKPTGGRTESQKKDIPFVQGQFNMGSSGVYPNASKPNGFQFLVSRRNPAHLGDDASDRDQEWGLTVVRRTQHASGSVYEYLAPMSARSIGDWGEVLSFPAETLPLLPESPPRHVPNVPYATEVSYGTLVKLYEYQYRTTGLSYSHALQKNGLLRAMDLALPECALPIRVVESRDFKGEPGSFQTNLMGAVYRFHRAAARDQEKASEDLESGDHRVRFEGPPVCGELTLRGVPIPWTAFVFRENAEDQTRAGACSLVYQVNGQKHAHTGSDFFRRKLVGLPYLAQMNTIFVAVDCTGLSNLQREEVFKPSRDRFRDSELSTELVKLLAHSIKSNENLAALQHSQHARVQTARLADRAPVRSILERLLKDMPTLARFFRMGPEIRTSKPFRDGEAGEGKGSGKFVGRRHPTFLRLKNGQTTRRQEAHIGARSRIQFTTDADDDYFSRGADTGYFVARYLNSSELVTGNRSDLRTGALSFSVLIPDTAKAGDTLTLEFAMDDPVLNEPLICRVDLDILEPPKPRPPGTNGTRGTSTQTGGKVGGQMTLDDLNVLKCCKEVPPREGCQSSWRPGWDEYTAVELEEDPDGKLTYFVNVSNFYLMDHQKNNPTKDPLLLEAKFMWSLLLLSIAIVIDYQKQEQTHDASQEVAEEIGGVQSFSSQRDEAILRLTRAVALMVFPVIGVVGSLTLETTEE